MPFSIARIWLSFDMVCSVSARTEDLLGLASSRSRNRPQKRLQIRPVARTVKDGFATTLVRFDFSSRADTPTASRLHATRHEPYKPFADVARFDDPEDSTMRS